jgi:UDP-N-acetylmuramyl pentapeptide phosphotransferase/UDP-N-acetylglucosamine-1-phosphate transferase
MDEKKPSPGRDSSLQKTRRMTGLAIFSAIIVVIQIVCTFVRFGASDPSPSLWPWPR